VNRSIKNARASVPARLVENFSDIEDRGDVPAGFFQFCSAYCALRSLSWNWFLAAYVALIAVLLFAPLAAHAASAPPVIDIPSVTVMENAGSAPVVILKTKASSYSKINVQTVDGTAKAGIDYKPVNVTLTLANNATSTRLPIAIIDNAAYQGSRQFSLKVAVLRFGQVAASYTPITVTINDDELRMR
jgi:hypothetical protein